MYNEFIGGEFRIKNFYKSQGYKDVNVNYDVEYSQNNKVKINFFISEGQQYYISNLNIKNNLDQNIEIDKINKQD